MNVDVDMSAIFMSLPKEKQRDVAERFVDQAVNSEQFGTIVIMPDINEDGEFDSDKPPKANMLDFKAIVKEYGKDYAVEMMMDLIGSGAVSCKTLSGKAVEELIEKCVNGEATPEEYAIANGILENMKNCFTRNDVSGLAMHIMLDFIDFCNVKHNTQPYLSDVMTVMLLLFIGSMTNQPGTPMARFRNSGPDATMNMITKITKDIDKALNKSIFKEDRPNNQFMALALMHLAGMYITKNEDGDKMFFADAQTLANMFGIKDTYGPNGKNKEKSEDED